MLLRACAFVEKTPTSVPFLVFAVLPCKITKSKGKEVCMTYEGLYQKSKPQFLYVDGY